MNREQCCRLCMSANTDEHLNIFSDIGIEMKLCEIISKYFDCEISEVDPLPNLVCQKCWQTTDAFHELYQKSKIVQESLLNPPIKFEPGESELWQSHQESIFVEEAHLEVGPVKPELNLDDSISNDNDQMDYGGSTFDSDDQSDDEDNGNITDKNDPDYKCSEDEEAKLPLNDLPSTDLSPKKLPLTKKPKRIRKPVKQTRAEKNRKFDQFCAEHKDLLKMNCDLCPTVFKNLREAREHYAKKHNNPNGYIKCCAAKLLYQSQVRDHIKNHFEPKTPKPKTRRKKNLACKICSKSFTSKQSLLLHRRAHKENDESKDGLYLKFIADHFDMKCDFCETVFRGYYEAREHYKEAHNEDKGYIKCCNVKLRERYLVKDHIKSHLEPEVFKCDICRKTFATRMNLVKHKHRHYLTKSKSFICDYCKRACRDKEQMVRHMFTKHKFVEAKFECKICHKMFQIESLLKTHMYTVHREKKSIGTCEICGKSFNTIYLLDKHKLQHIDKSERLIERTQCEHCGDWIATSSGLFYHQQIHTSGPQKCKHCEMELPNRVALLGHIRNHHREHKYKCNYCGKTFSIPSTLKKHEESHTRDRVYSCKFCDKTFTVASSLSTHMGRDHPEERKRLREMRKLKRIPAHSKAD
ncbi:transcription factor grauzone-like isoform X2 [Sitodiplosis mosellana]|uniref:transcription factor grauzone-like isoform X2 n=1 Tax=Sitodiplosis mosellana TaxID=263140 RepID=UPI002444AA8A|nr:transcription factor grauzone-like isoform X2 [Sitodiplosis mosellana]